MILVYLLVLLLLGGVSLWFRRRAKRLEKKFMRTASQADTLLRQNSLRGGTTNRPDPYQAARKQLELGLIVQKRDAIEARYTRWQARAERVAYLLSRAQNWQGKKLPYLFGMIDLAGAFLLTHYLSAGQIINLDGLLQAIHTLLAHHG
jgi:hypothetical protein